LNHFTHAYFPTEKFDEYNIKGNYAFARVKNTYLAFIGKEKLYLGQNIADTSKTSTNDLIQSGADTYWITEVSSRDIDGSFGHFKTRTQNNEVTFDSDLMQVSYVSHKSHSLQYKGNYKVNNEVMDLEYQRFEAIYSNTKRESKTMIISFDNKTLELDFYNMKRCEK
jgi:hypothetical protein